MCLLWHIFKDGCNGTSFSRIAHFFDKDFIELPRKLGPYYDAVGQVRLQQAMWSQRSHRPPKKKLSNT